VGVDYNQRGLLSARGLVVALRGIRAGGNREGASQGSRPRSSILGCVSHINRRVEARGKQADEPTFLFRSVAAGFRRLAEVLDAGVPKKRLTIQNVEKPSVSSVFGTPASRRHDDGAGRITPDAVA
jgi:hypothetical protein